MFLDSAIDNAIHLGATPAVLKRPTGTYGSLDYILIHELGHRYEEKFGSDPMFNRWYTTRYSYNDGEAFAELFALGHFGITKVRSDDFGERLKNFENKMK